MMLNIIKKRTWLNSHNIHFSLLKYLFTAAQSFRSALLCRTAHWINPSV